MPSHSASLSSQRCNSDKTDSYLRKNNHTKNCFRMTSFNLSPYEASDLSLIRATEAAAEEANKYAYAYCMSQQQSCSTNNPFKSVSALRVLFAKSSSFSIPSLLESSGQPDELASDSSSIREKAAAASDEANLCATVSASERKEGQMSSNSETLLSPLEICVAASSTSITEEVPKGEGYDTGIRHKV